MDSQFSVHKFNSLLNLNHACTRPCTKLYKLQSTKAYFVGIEGDADFKNSVGRKKCVDLCISACKSNAMLPSVGTCLITRSTSHASSFGCCCYSLLTED